MQDWVGFLFAFLAKQLALPFIFNLLNDHGIDVLGAPPGGILGFAQASYTYSGLDL